MNNKSSNKSLHYFGNLKSNKIALSSTQFMSAPPLNIHLRFAINAVNRELCWSPGKAGPPIMQDHRLCRPTGYVGQPVM